MVDDKLRILAAMKQVMQDRLTTVFQRQGHGTPEGIPAIEQSIFDGVPINVTLLFSRDHYVAAANAYLRGIERRIEAGLDPKVESVASLFVSRWDVVVKEV